MATENHELDTITDQKSLDLHSRLGPGPKAAKNLLHQTILPIHSALPDRADRSVYAQTNTTLLVVDGLVCMLAVGFRGHHAGKQHLRQHSRIW